MAITLTKGQRINLTKDNPKVKRVRVGLGWKANTSDTGYAFDLDASVFCCKRDTVGNPKLLADEFFVFYNNLKSPCGGVQHTGDDRTGSGSGEEGDDETIMVDLGRIDPRLEEISFIVTIYDAPKRHQSFGQVRDAYIKIYDDETGAQLCAYKLDEDFSKETAVQFGSLYVREGQWRFHAVGQGYNVGLDAFVRQYGGHLA